jgi:hypothetical protein
MGLDVLLLNEALLGTFAYFLDEVALLSLPCISREASAIFSPEGPSSHILDGLYQYHCSTSSSVRLSCLTDVDVLAGYGEFPLPWREAFLTQGQRSKCDATEVCVDISALVGRLKHCKCFGNPQLKGVSTVTGEPLFASEDEHGVEEESELDSHWHAIVTNSEPFSLAGSLWSIQVQLLRSRCSVGIYLVDESLSSMAQAMMEDEYELMMEEDNNKGSMRVQMALLNGVDPSRTKTRTFCNSFSSISSSWGWNAFIPASLLSTDDLGFRRGNSLRIRVCLQWWLNDILSNPSLPAPARALTSREVYWMWQDALMQNGWHCTGYHTSSGQLVRLSAAEHCWLDRMVARSRSPTGQEDRLKGRIVRILLHCRRDMGKAERYLGQGRHVGITCDGCGAFEFKGLRFRCSVCPNYDLCDACSSHSVQSYRHKAYHELLALPPNCQLISCSCSS